MEPILKCVSLAFFQVLRDRQLQGRSDRRVQAQSGDAPRGRHHLQVQEGQPHHVRLGDQGPAPGRGRLLSRQRPQRQLNQQVSSKSIY